jgi:hypothetical protein
MHLGVSRNVLTLGRVHVGRPITIVVTQKFVSTRQTVLKAEVIN